MPSAKLIKIIQNTYTITVQCIIDHTKPVFINNIRRLICAGVHVYVWVGISTESRRQAFCPLCNVAGSRNVFGNSDCLVTTLGLHYDEVEYNIILK